MICLHASSKPDRNKTMLRPIIVVLLAVTLATSARAEALPGTEDARACDTKSGQEGIDACTRLIKLYPKMAFAYYNRAINYSRKGDIDLAIADYTTAIELQPTENSFYNNRGSAYDKK